jgi:hypothetical protein
MKLIILLLFIVNLSFSQITSATINGKVLVDDKPLIKSKITLIFLPTNSQYETDTDKYGRFSLDNLEVGGPFKIIIESDETYDYVKSDIYLILGDNDIPNINVIKKY